MLKGKKTYVVALGGVLLAVGGVLSGQMTWAEALQSFVLSGGLATMRAALSAAATDVKDVKAGLFIVDDTAKAQEEVQSPVASSRFGTR